MSIGAVDQVVLVTAKLTCRNDELRARRHLFMDLSAPLG